jgi:hypothetical protein
MGTRARLNCITRMEVSDEKLEVLGAALMVFLTPTRGKAMVHRVLVLVQLGQDSTFNHTECQACQSVLISS